MSINSKKNEKLRAMVIKEKKERVVTIEAIQKTIMEGKAFRDARIKNHKVITNRKNGRVFATRMDEVGNQITPEKEISTRVYDYHKDLKRLANEEKDMGIK